MTQGRHRLGPPKQPDSAKTSAMMASTVATAPIARNGHVWNVSTCSIGINWRATSPPRRFTAFSNAARDAAASVLDRRRSESSPAALPPTGKYTRGVNAVAQEAADHVADDADHARTELLRRHLTRRQLRLDYLAGDVDVAAEPGGAFPKGRRELRQSRRRPREGHFFLLLHRHASGSTISRCASP